MPIPDFLIIVFLILALLFCWRLNSRLKKMRELSEDIPPFVKNLGIYAHNISNTLDNLKTIVHSNERSLQENIPQAKALREEFDILLEHSEKLTHRLDAVIEKARNMDRQLHNTLQLARGFQLKEQTNVVLHPHMDDSHEESIEKEHQDDDRFTASEDDTTALHTPPHPSRIHYRSHASQVL